MLKEYLSYNPETGIFTWLKRPRLGMKAGDIAGCLNKDSGYIQIVFRGEKWFAQRLAWWFMTDEFPELDVDHKNRIKTDNRWANLRLATRSESRYNTKLPKNNTSGCKGVTFRKREQKWRARIFYNRKEIHLGYFTDKELAIAAYLKAAKDLHGEFSIYEGTC